jgi:hypothetical protein
VRKPQGSVADAFEPRMLDAAYFIDGQACDGRSWISGHNPWG